MDIVMNVKKNVKNNHYTFDDRGRFYSIVVNKEEDYAGNRSPRNKGYIA